MQDHPNWMFYPFKMSHHNQHLAVYTLHAVIAALTLYPRYVNSIASVNDIKAKNNCTAHNSVGRFTQVIASQLIIGRSWNSSSVKVADSRNSVLLPTVHPKLCQILSSKWRSVTAQGSGARHTDEEKVEGEVEEKKKRIILIEYLSEMRLGLFHNSLSYLQFKWVYQCIHAAYFTATRANNAACNSP